jgi:hypothetical protein
MTRDEILDDFNACCPFIDAKGRTFKCVNSNFGDLLSSETTGDIWILSRSLDFYDNHLVLNMKRFSIASEVLCNGVILRDIVNYVLKPYLV